MDGARASGPAAWASLAVAAAGTAGSLALVVTAARLPLFAGLLPPETFYRALVGHVTFSLVVWLLSCSVAVGLRSCSADSPRWAAPLAGGGAVAMVTGLLSGGRPVVVDYLPYVDSLAFLLGYGLFAAGVAGALWPCITQDVRPGSRSLAVAYVASLVAVVVGLARVGPQAPQAALWGGGHALQFVYVTALALSWYELAGQGLLGESSVSRLGFTLSAALAWLPALTYSVAADAPHLPRAAALNLFTGIALSVPTLLHLTVLLPRLLRETGPGGVCLRWSVALYLLGGLLAPWGAANTLRVTAHYHAMLVGGVTTAFMGVVYRIVEGQGVPVHDNATRFQLHLFGLGVLLTVAALLVAEAAGLPRKAYLAGTHPWRVPFVLLMSAAILSTAGGAWFLGSAARLLGTCRRRPAGSVVPAATAGG